ncbi:MAG: DUF4440 domain-containing protein, partial [Thermoanaerobaculia bacterium]
MTLPIGLFLLALAGTASGGHAEPGDRRPADVAAIRSHIERIFQAYQRKDRQEVRRTHTADWRGFLTGSRGVLRGIDAYMREAEGFLGGSACIERWSFRELDALFYGEMGIVNYVADLEIALEGGARLPDTLRVIDIYRRFRGEWEQVASQVARHPDALETRSQQPQPLSAPEQAKLLADREAVWRSFFAGDGEALGRLLPEDLVAINAGEEAWLDRAGALASAADFANSGGRLRRLEFPKTEIRAYGDTAILYTTYL